MWNSKTLWSFAICKLIIKDIRKRGAAVAPAGTLKNWRKCIEYLAAQISMDAVLMYNTTTPGEYLNRFGIRDYYWARLQGWPISYLRNWPWNDWAQARVDFDRRKGTPYEFNNMPLPGSVVSSTVEAKKIPEVKKCCSCRCHQ